MAVRQPVGVALALVIGVAIGYAVSPAAQGVTPIRSLPPPPYQQIKLRVAPLDQNRVSVTVEAGEAKTFTGRQIELAIDQTHVIVPPTDGTSFGQVYELPRR